MVSGEAAASPIAEIAAGRKRMRIRRGCGAVQREIGSRNGFGKRVLHRGTGNRSGLLEPQGQIARIGVVEQHAGALVEHVGIDALGP
jgi:hypothetical protein